MTIKPIFKVLAALVMTGMLFGANAASISFDMDTYVANPGEQVSVTLNYDFTDIDMLGGGLDLLYDASVLEFVSYTQTFATGAGFPEPGVPSPVGSLTAPGSYINTGIGSFAFLTGGINTAGEMGVFVFTVLGAGGDGGCGATMCLSENAGNPFFAVDGSSIDVFATGISQANVVPVPAAVWFMLSGLGALLGFGRRSA